MWDLLGKPWSKVQVEDIEAFLADAGDEGILWEAKGTEQPHAGSVRKAICGFANALGGLYIIGAEKSAGGGWTLPGVIFNTDEPGTWITAVISAGVSPSPDVGDPKVFERDKGRKAVVVRVEAAEVPPCVTSEGAIYQRVSGQTQKVTDQSILSALLQKGRVAREQAEAKALDAAHRSLMEHGFLDSDKTLFSVALCPLGGPNDRSGLLFKNSTAKAFGDLVWNRLQDDAVLRYAARGEVAQDSLRAWFSNREVISGWTGIAYWSGAVAAVYGTPTVRVNRHDVVARTEQAWKALSEAVELVGGFGQTHVVVRFNAMHIAAETLNSAYPKDPIRRWTIAPAPTQEDLGRVQRELRRGFGETAWEPE